MTARRFADVVDEVRPCVVQIGLLRDGSLQRVGTGLWVDPAGLVLTAAHVAAAATGPPAGEGEPAELRVGVALPPDERSRGNFVHLPARVATIDDEHDLSVLAVRPSPFGQQPVRVDGADLLLPAAVARLTAERPRDGEDLAVSGYPVAEPVLLTTTGTVASAWAFDLAQLADLPGPALTVPEDVYLVDATVNPGNSGGPVYRRDTGAVVGVCLAQRLHRTADGSAGQPVTYPSGLAVVAPGRYALDLLDPVRHGRAAPVDPAR